MSDESQQPINPENDAISQDVPAPVDPPADHVSEPFVAHEPVTADVPPPPVSNEPVAPAPAQWPTAGYPAPSTGAYPPAAYLSYPGTAPAPVQTQTSSNAVVALILAVASWAVCPLIAAVVALVFASMASKEIAASGGRVQGEGLVTASKIVAWINIGLTVAAVVIGAFVLVLIAIAGGFSSTTG